MLRIVRALATQPYVSDLCRETEIAVDTWLAITVNDVIAADTATGRGMRTSQVVASDPVSRTPRTVRRARSVSVRLGILVELYRGRELSRDERLALLAESPGHGQRGIPNVYAVTVCPARQRARISTPRPGRYAQVYRFVHLPPVGGLSLSTHLLDIIRYAAAGASAGPEPPPAAQPRRPRRPGMALAHELMRHPGLVRLLGVRPGTIAGQLAAYQRGGWHGTDLANAVLEVAAGRGIPTWRQAREPYALLKALLSRIDTVADVHLGTGTPAPAAETTPAGMPCRHPGCDHGWIDDVDTRGYTVTRPCPLCPPAARASTHHTELVDDEPAF